MKYLTENPTTNALLGSSAVLILIVAMQWASPYQASPSEAQPDVASVSAEIIGVAPSRYVHPHESNFAEITTRPVFFSNRQMPPEPVVQAAAPQTPLRLKLEGIAMTADNRVAILRNLGSNQLVQLTEGMTHDGWLLAEITSRTATFRRDTDVSKLSLDIESSR